jgi:hypothetical protein
VRCAAVLAAAIGTGAPDPVHAQAAPASPIDGMALVRCVADRPLPCVRVRVRMPDAAAADGDVAEDARTWSGRLGPYLLQPVRVRMPGADGPPRVVLTLVDVSGSMGANGGMQVARAAVRSFVHDLGADGDGAVRAGVAAFASRAVVAGVRAAPLGVPDAAAAAVDRLPPPAGNTALYSAVTAGVERVAEAARELGPDALPALVVVTDGRNDVLDPAGRPRPGDDPDLATGEPGRAAAAAAARRLGVPLFLVGVGTEPDMAELRALAGERGLAFRTAVDAVALREALARVQRALTPGREVTFVVSGAERTSLARAGWPVEVAWRPTASPGSTAEAARWTGTWRAPLLVAPPFAGAEFANGLERAPAGERALRPSDEAPAWVRAAAEEAPVAGRRAVVATFLALLVGACWWLPRALWRGDDGEGAAVPVGAPAAGAAGPRVAPPTAVPHAAPTAGAAGAPTGSATGAGVLRTLPLRPGAGRAAGAAPPPPPAAEPGGVRADVREAPPRRPADVTAAGARRRGAGGEPDRANPVGRMLAVNPSRAATAPGGPEAGGRPRSDFDQR